MHLHYGQVKQHGWKRNFHGRRAAGGGWRKRTKGTCVIGNENSTLIRIHDIVKYYGSTCALDHASLEVGPGITGLLGPNGAGKSTLIKIILGLIPFQGGSGEILGLDLKRAGRRIREVTGYMPEDDCYIPGMSGVEVVRFSAILAGLPPVEGLRRAHEILDFCGVQQERYRDIETYSAGMRQKIKFASAIVHDPKLLIFDEPTSFLDPEEREDLLNRIRLLAREFGKAVILCTHILRDVQMVCDQVVILLKGRVRMSASMEVLSRPTEAVTELQVDGDPTPLTRGLAQRGIRCDGSLNGSLRVLSDRPEDLQAVWEVARDAGIAIHSMSPTRNSLEAIFMTAVRGEADADQ
jgi:ABC-2 type transport system ATP-binding protein